MVIINAPATLAIAAAVWLIWRVVVWRRRGGDAVREFVITALFLVTLLIVQITQFPMKIIFYDWASVINLVPFASITQLIRFTNTRVAFENIVGNVLLFMPLGFLLPFLFRRLQRPWPMIWRGAAMSIAIEVTQLLTRARAVDIDDVILNTLGAALGFVVYRALAWLVRRFAFGRRLLDRLAADTEREPLLLPLAPVGVTLMIAVPVMLSTVISATLSQGDAVDDALARTPNGTVVALAEVEEYSFVLVEAPPIVTKYDYQRVLPGRFAPTAWGDLSSEAGSRFTWGLTPYNTAKRERPRLLIWGVNEQNAKSVTVTGNGITETLALPNDRYFVVGFIFDIETHLAPDANLADFDFTFIDAAGNDVSHDFDLTNR